MSNTDQSNIRRIEGQNLERRQAEIVKIVQKARAKNAWIYNPLNKTWYTPDEFAAISVMFHDVQIRDPLEGLEAGYKQLEHVKSKLKLFTKKLIDYYANSKPKQ